MHSRIQRLALDGRRQRLYGARTMHIIIASFALALLVAPAVALADAQDQGIGSTSANQQSGGPSGSGRYDERKGNYLTREVAPGINEQTRIPKNFTTREQGDHAARNSCGCTKGGSSSRGKTGSDMGY